MRFSLVAPACALPLCLMCQPPGAPGSTQEGARDASNVPALQGIDSQSPGVTEPSTTPPRAELGAAVLPSGGLALRRAVMEERWEEAARLFDQTVTTPSAEQRFLRARIALALSDKAKARALLVDLDKELPAIAPYVLQAQKDAQTRNVVATSPAASPSATTKPFRVESPPARAVSKRAIYQQAERFAAKGWLDRTLDAIERMKLATGRGPSKAEVARTTAWAYYKSRRDYAKAAELFGKAAKWSAEHRAQDLFYEARAWSRADHDHKAIKLYKVMRRRFPKSKWAEEAHYLGARLYYFLGEWPKAMDAYTEYLRTRGKRAKHQVGARYARAVSALVARDVAKAQADLSWLTARTQNKRDAAWYHYLSARALEQSDESDFSAVKRAYRAVMQERPLSFAALMSAARLKRLGEGVPSPFVKLPVSAATDESLMDNKSPGQPPAASKDLSVRLPKEVALLNRLGLVIDAESALNLAAKKLRDRYAPRGNEALCKAYASLGAGNLGYRHGLKVVRERVLLREVTAETRWLWRCIYPRPFERLVKERAAANGLPEALIYGVMRQESAFNARIKSPVGAVGLMQLMPATAKGVAKLVEVPAAALHLERPSSNVLLGAAYLKRVVDRFDGHPALAVAAYNAGPGAVLRWLRSSSGLELDLFVARIPYDETRGYVRRVMANWARYTYLDDEPMVELPLTLPTVPPKATDDF